MSTPFAGWRDPLDGGRTGAEGFVLVFDPDGGLTDWSPSTVLVVPELAPLLVRGTPGDALAHALEPCLAGDRFRLAGHGLADGGSAWVATRAAGPPASQPAPQPAGHQAETLFRAIADALPLGLAVSALGDGGMRYCNRPYAALMGVRPEDILGRPAAGFYLDPEDRRRLVDWVERHDFLQGCETRLKRPDGTDFWAMVSARRITWEGERCVLAIAVDLTDRKRLEEGLDEARAAAARAARAKDRFLAVANHDLHQPLAALAMFVGALEVRLSEPGAREILRAMDGALGALRSLVETHLDMARIDAGMLRPVPASHPANAMITRMALEFAGAARAKGLRLSVQPCSALVHTDRDLLERILRNLLSNAIRFTDGGRVLLGCRRRGDQLAIQVWDTGRGIPEAQHHLVFEEFWRADPSPAVGGFGLGLAIVDRLAALLGHRLEMCSVEGHGTMFSITMPVATDEPAPSLPALAPLPEPGARVLVIEDDLQVLDALQVLLGQWGCAVIGAASSEEALEAVAAGERPDVVIADLRLGGSATGIAAIRQVAKLLGGPVPGLILTADTDPRRLREARLSGYPLLHKPVSAHALRGTLGALLGQRLR